MQTIASRKHALVDYRKVALLATVLVALAIASIVTYVLRTDATEQTAAPSNAPVTAQMPSWRVLEENALPESPAQWFQRATNWRFMEINKLPVAPAIAPIPVERQRLIEANLLPADTDVLAVPGSAQDNR